MAGQPGDDHGGSIVTWIDRPARPGPLNGLRVGVKDLIAVEGVPRLCGAPELVDAAPSRADAAAVAHLVEAGAHLVATTATHEFGWGVITPGTRNPRAPDRIAGGSSGGSAAALAAGIVDGALGTDTAGSIRIPAACCGVTGLRTTERLAPRDGVQPLAPTFDVVGPLARDVATLVRLLAALTSTTVDPRVPSPLRVGVVREVVDAPLDPEVRTAWNDVLSALRAEGARVVDVALPRLVTAPAVMMTILEAEELQVHRDLVARASHLLSPGVRRAFERSAAVEHSQVLDARRAAAMWRNALTGVFATADVLLLPVLPCKVPAVGAHTVDVYGVAKRVGAALTRLTSPWSLGGVCAGAVPVALDSGGGPIGVQVVGAWHADATVLAVMGLVERISGGPWPSVAASR